MGFYGTLPLDSSCQNYTSRIPKGNEKVRRQEKQGLYTPIFICTETKETETIYSKFYTYHFVGAESLSLTQAENTHRQRPRFEKQYFTIKKQYSVTMHIGSKNNGQKN